MEGFMGGKIGFLNETIVPVKLYSECQICAGFVQQAPSKINTSSFARINSHRFDDY